MSLPACLPLAAAAFARSKQANGQAAPASRTHTSCCTAARTASYDGAVPVRLAIQRARPGRDTQRRTLMRKTLAILSLASLAALASGCSTWDNLSRAEKGAVIGAGAGGRCGRRWRDRTRSRPSHQVSLPDGPASGSRHFAAPATGNGPGGFALSPHRCLRTSAGASSFPAPPTSAAPSWSGSAGTCPPPSSPCRARTAA